MELSFILQVTREIGLAGGTECVAFELHRAWLAMGLDAQVITSHATEAEAPEGMTLVGAWLRSWGLGPRMQRLAIFLVVPLFTLAATWRVCRTRGAKIVLSHGDSLIGDVCVVHAINRASLAEKRRAGYYRGLLNPSNLWVAWRDRWMLRGNRYRKIVAVSERVRRQLKKYYGVPDDRIVTISNGVNLARFNPRHGRSRAEVRLSFGIPQGVPLLLFVGSQFRLKGLEFAIKALAEMETKAYLLVVGADSSTTFKRMAEQAGVGHRVIFAGARSDLPLIYPAADALVFPTLYETFALVCLEAMASGLPVLASPVGGIEDYLRDGENGFFIERDASDIAAKLDRLLGDPDLSARVRENGLATASRYGWEKIARQYLCLFEELIGDRASTLPPLSLTDRRVSVSG